MIERVKNNKILLSLAIGIIAVALLLVFRIAYAYLAAGVNAARGNVVANSEAVDEFKFIEGDPLSIAVTPTTLPENGENLVVSSKPKVTLKANESTESAKYNYYIYLNITANTFTYTKEDKTPEILLSVTKPNGDELTSIKGFEYTTVYGASGFDVTEHTGLIKIVLNEEITSDSSSVATELEWTISLTYLNFETDQSANYGNKLDTEILLKKEPILTLAEYVQAQYTVDGENNLYYHDGEGDYTNANLEAGDKSYRYAGPSADVNNYVCVGSSETTCPVNNLYRIIGAFPTDETLENYQVKLIKNTSIGQYYWSGSDSNHQIDWDKSTLQSDVLNKETGEYWKSLGTDASKVINHNWVISGGPYSGIIGDNNAQIAYNYEVAKECSTCTGKQEYTTLPNKVGLMYISDYMYASNPSGWNVTGSNYSSNKANNWLHLSNSGKINAEWTISHRSDMADVSNIAFTVDTGGNTGFAYVYNSSYDVRPSIYLESTVQLFSGSGTDTDPFRIK